MQIKFCTRTVCEKCMFSKVLLNKFYKLTIFSLRKAIFNSRILERKPRKAVKFERRTIWPPSSDFKYLGRLNNLGGKL